jgi:predicted dehydrogenase
MATPVRVAILGNGFAARVQLPALAAAGGNQVVGIAGHDPARAEETARRFGIPHATGDWRELLALQPDLVLVTTPVDLHAPMVHALLDETQAALVCEKPFAMDAAEAAPLVEKARGRLALIDHQLRFGPYRQRMKQLVGEGFVGDVWHARVHASWGRPEVLTRPFTWWYDAARGGGILGAGASHLVDGLRDLLGDVASVQGTLDTHVKERTSADGPRTVTADEHARLWLAFKSGARASVDTDLCFPHGPFLHTFIAGSEGVLELRDEAELQGARHGEPLKTIDVDAGAWATKDPALVGYGPFGRCEPIFLARVLDAVREGRTEVEGAATFADGLATMRVLDAVRASAAASS